MSATSDDEALEYLNATLRRGDATAFLLALRKRARGLGMSRVAESGRMNRENLYRMLSADGNPTSSDLLNVLTTLGVRLEVNRRGAKLAAFSDGDERFNDVIRGNSSEPTKHGKSDSLKRRPFATALQPTLAKRLKHCAREQGISFETLVNLWLSEKLIEAGE